MKKQATKTTAKIETKTVATPKAKKAPVAIAAPAPVALPEPVAAPESVSKRITPGAEIKEWRVVPSQRKGMPGFFLQGGRYEVLVNGRNSFVCGSESFFEDRKEAQAALVQKRQAAA